MKSDTFTWSYKYWKLTFTACADFGGQLLTTTGRLAIAPGSRLVTIVLRLVTIVLRLRACKKNKI